MPDSRMVDAIHLRADLAMAGLNNETDEIFNEDIDVVLGDTLEGVLYQLDPTVDILNHPDEDLITLAYSLGEHIAEQIAVSLIDMRDVLREADELASLIERYEEADEDWEV